MTPTCADTLSCKYVPSTSKDNFTHFNTSDHTNATSPYTSITYRTASADSCYDTRTHVRFDGGTVRGQCDAALTRCQRSCVGRISSSDGFRR